jgi:soluble lytic murein transglycosylase-like protein
VSSVSLRLSALAIAVAMLTAACTHTPPETAPAGPTTTPDAALTPLSLASLMANPDPARYAPQVRTYAAAAAIDPQLLMAILYNENYKPHDPAMQRAWLSLSPDASLGIANMHKAAFDDTKRGRDFAGRSWEELPDDPALAVEAAAWYLHDLASHIPAGYRGPYSDTDLLAIGYNAGPSTLSAAVNGSHLTDSVEAYLNELHTNWTTAAQALS